MERSAVTPDAAGQPSAHREPRDSRAPSTPSAASPAGARSAAQPNAQPPGPPREYRREAWEMAMRRNKVVRWFVSWLPHRVTIALRTLLRLEHTVVAKVGQRWHRSLQLRVIGTTLV